MAPPSSASEATEMRDVRVRLNHYSSVLGDEKFYTIQLAADGSDSIATLKQKISDALSGALPPEDIRVYFAPVDLHIGKEYKGDPYVDEKKLKVADFSFLSWMDKYPSWYLTMAAQPGPPPPPGVAEVKAASMIEDGITPEEAVLNARKEGKLARVADLPKPWGSKPVEPVPYEHLVALKKVPAKYPAESAPAINI
mmetsp:Transcript_23949/g.60257  ORF Transcript_23949/g.60257 Transcript_23949/m.60257 type:complete len:196 (+) Transcript_23949:300-887(+)